MARGHWCKALDDAAVMLQLLRSAWVVMGSLLELLGLAR